MDRKGCSEPNRCKERDKAECEWCLAPFDDLPTDEEVINAANEAFALAEAETEYGHNEAMDDLWNKTPHEFVGEVTNEQKGRVAEYITSLEEKAALAEAAVEWLISPEGQEYEYQLVMRLTRENFNQNTGKMFENYVFPTQEYTQKMREAAYENARREVEGNE